jgi:hypothetical protein
MEGGTNGKGFPLVKKGEEEVTYFDFFLVSSYS